MNTRSLVKERSFIRLAEWQRFYVGKVVDTESEEALGRGLRLTGSTFGHLNRIARTMVDLRDPLLFEGLFVEWRSLMSDLVEFPNHVGPLREGFQDAISAEYARLMLGLAMWSQHRIEHSEDEDQMLFHVRSFNLFAEEIARWSELSVAIERAEANHEPWDSWFGSEKPPYEVHTIETRNELRRTYLLLMIRSQSSADETSPLTDEIALYWMSDLRMMLSAIEENGPLDPLLESFFTASEDAGVVESASLSDRAMREMHNLAETLERWSDEAQARSREELRQKPLSQEKLQKFERLVRTQVAEAHLFLDLCEVVGPSQTHEEPVDLEPRGQKVWLPKELFVDDGNMIGEDLAANDFSRAVRIEDKQSFIRLLVDSKLETLSGRAVREAVEQVIDAMRLRGFSPSLIVTPLSWRLNEELLGRTFWRGGLSAPHALVPNKHADKFAGVIGGVPVLSAANIDAHRIHVIDLEKFVRVDRWIEDPAAISLNLRSFDVDSATEAVVDGVVNRADDMPEEDAIAFLQERILAEFKIGWRLVRMDTAAARAVEVPSEFRER